MVLEEYYLYHIEAQSNPSTARLARDTNMILIAVLLEETSDAFTHSATNSAIDII